MPLRVHPTNPRYFADQVGDAVYLTGSHTWNNLQDIGMPLCFDDHLERLARLGHNFVRLWTFEQSKGMQWAQYRKDAEVSPCIFRRIGPGLAADGKPRFDLTQIDPAFLKRQRAQVCAALDRGIYVSIMLFMGFSVDHVDENGVPWIYHPFHRANNVNDIDGDPHRRGNGVVTHTLEVDDLVRLQEAYVQRVVENLNEFDNVLFEISNESGPHSTAWQHHMLRFIRQLEGGLAKQHPIGMTFQYEGGANRTLLESPADFISPNAEGGWDDDPPEPYAGKIVINDTDHLWGIGGGADWVWKTFCRGHCPIFMDPWDGALVNARDNPWRAIDPDPIRRAMGTTRRIALELNLARTLPHGELCSSRYCLAEPGEAYVAFQPEAGVVEINAIPGVYRLRLVDPGGGDVREDSVLSVAQRDCLAAVSVPAPTVLWLVRGER